MRLCLVILAFSFVSLSACAPSEKPEWLGGDFEPVAAEFVSMFEEGCLKTSAIAEEIEAYALRKGWESFDEDQPSRRSWRSLENPFFTLIAEHSRNDSRDYIVCAVTTSGASGILHPKVVQSEMHHIEKALVGRSFAESLRWITPLNEDSSAERITARAEVLLADQTEFFVGYSWHSDATLGIHGLAAFPRRAAPNE